MNTINPNDPAFPINIGTGKYTGMNVIDGMSIRTEIASRCMAGLLANQYGWNKKYDFLAEESIKYADALIAQLNK